MRVMLPACGPGGDAGPMAGFAVAMAASDPDRD